MEFLKDLRVNARLPAAEIAKKMGVTVHGYRRWERSEVEPRAHQVVQLAEILNCSTDALLKGEPELHEAQKLRVQVQPGKLVLVEILGEEKEEVQPEKGYTPSFKLRNTKRKKTTAQRRKVGGNVA